MSGAKEIFEQMREWVTNHPDDNDPLLLHMDEENPNQSNLNTQNNDNQQRQLRAG